MIEALKQRRRSPKITDAEKAIIRGLRETGMTIREIARQSGRAKPSIERVCADMPRRPQGNRSTIDQAMVFKALEGGASVAEIAKTIGRSKTAVHDFLARSRAAGLVVPAPKTHENSADGAPIDDTDDRKRGAARQRHANLQFLADCCKAHGHPADVASLSSSSALAFRPKLAAAWARMMAKDDAAPSVRTGRPSFSMWGRDLSTGAAP